MVLRKVAAAAAAAAAQTANVNFKTESHFKTTACTLTYTHKHRHSHTPSHTHAGQRWTVWIVWLSAVYLDSKFSGPKLNDTNQFYCLCVCVCVCQLCPLRSQTFPRSLMGTSQPLLFSLWSQTKREWTEPPPLHRLSRPQAPPITPPSQRQAGITPTVLSCVHVCT